MEASKHPKGIRIHVIATALAIAGLGIESRWTGSGRLWCPDFKCRWDKSWTGRGKRKKSRLGAWLGLMLKVRERE